MPPLPPLLLTSFLVSSASAPPPVTNSTPVSPVIPKSADSSESICQRHELLLTLCLSNVLSRLLREPMEISMRKDHSAFRSSFSSSRRRAPKSSVLMGSVGIAELELSASTAASGVRDDVLPTVASGESARTRSGAPSFGLRLLSPMPAFSFSLNLFLISCSLAEMNCAIVCINRSGIWPALIRHQIPKMMSSVSFCSSSGGVPESSDMR